MHSCLRREPMLLLRTTILGFVIVVAGATASAQESKPLDPAAQAHLEAGDAAYRAADYVNASSELEAAYKIDPQPVLLYAWAQARRMAGACDEAIALYRRYVATGVTDSQAAAANAGIGLCEKSMAAAPRTNPPPPGPETATVVAPLNEAPRSERAQWYQNTRANILTVSGVVVTGAGIGFLIAAERSEDRVRNAEYRDDFGELLDQTTLRRRIGYPAAGVGVALVVAGVVAYASGHDRRPDMAAVGTDGTTVFLRGAF